MLRVLCFDASIAGFSTQDLSCREVSDAWQGFHLTKLLTLTNPKHEQTSVFFRYAMLTQPRPLEVAIAEYVKHKMKRPLISQANISHFA